MFHIRKTEERDFEHVMEIYAEARKFMAEHGNPHQWGDTVWPHADVVKTDIRTGKGYVCEKEDGQVVGVFYYDYGMEIEPCYTTLQSGKWGKEGAYGVVHRIASCEKGVGSFCLAWAYERCGHLRIDTHPDNKVMQSLLSKCGFVACGTTHVSEDNDLRIVYEK